MTLSRSFPTQTEEKMERRVEMLFQKDGRTFYLLDSTEIAGWSVQLCKEHFSTVDAPLGDAAVYTAFITSPEHGRNSFCYITDPQLSLQEVCASLHQRIAVFQLQQAEEQLAMWTKGGRYVS